jgi:hypothetical protein
MKAVEKCRAMEGACRRHAELDKTTATSWLEEAEVWSRLERVERRLQLLGTIRRPRTARPLETTRRSR